MSARPGWARSCTCGQTPDSYFCSTCMAWAGTSYGDQASWSEPRSTKPRGRPCANTGETCECLPGSVAEAHCATDAKREEPAPRSMRLDH